MNWGHSSAQDSLQGQRGNVNPLPREEILSFSPGPAGGRGEGARGAVARRALKRRDLIRPHKQSPEGQ